MPGLYNMEKKKKRTNHLLKWVEPQESLVLGYTEITRRTGLLGSNRLETAVGKANVNLRKQGFYINPVLCKYGE